MEQIDVVDVDLFHRTGVVGARVRGPHMAAARRRGKPAYRRINSCSTYQNSSAIDEKRLTAAAVSVPNG